MNRNHTRNALVSSVIALLLCVSMLIGTTFAWFTDTVQSDINTIAAGNLDIELTHQDKNSSGVVDSATKLFDDVALWEPGAMVYEKLTVTNKGSLALKYQLSVNISDITTLSNGNSLKDVLKVAVMTEVPTRENIKTAETKLLETFVLSGDLELKDESDTYYIAIYWAPSASDNDYNVAGEALKATLGVSLVATQMTNEEDSFNDQFDVNASYPAVSIVTGSRELTLGVDEAPSAITKKTTVKVPAGAFSDGAEVGINVDAANSLFNVSAEGDVVGSLDVIMTVNGVQHEDELTGGKTYTVTTYISTGLSNVTVAYTGTDGRAQPTNVQYDPATGKLSFETTHFSEYAVSGKAIAYDVATDTAYTTVEKVVEALTDGTVVETVEDISKDDRMDLAVQVQDAIESGDIEVDAPALNGVQEVLSSVAMVDTGDALIAALDEGKDVVLTGDITLNETATIPAEANIVLDLNGKTITSTKTSGVAILVKGVAKIVNGAVVTSDGVGGIEASGANAALTLSNMTVDANGTGSNSEWNTSALQASYKAVIIVESGSYSSEAGSGVISKTSGSTIVINGGTFSTDLSSVGAAVRVDTGWSGSLIANVTINGGVFNAPNNGLAIRADGMGNAGITVVGGEFNGRLESNYSPFVIQGGTFNKTIFCAGGHQNHYTISGGTFVDNLITSTISNCKIAAGYAALQSGDVFVVLPAGFEIVAEGVMKNEAGEYLITNANGLLWMNQQTAGFFGGKTIKLYNDIDCTGFDIKSIYIWDSENPAVFDGQGYTIYNMDISSASDSDNQGLLYGTLSIKNLTIDGAWVQGNGYVAVLAGQLYGNIDNCHVKNSFVYGNYWQVGGLVGMYNSGSISNSSVVDTEICGPSAVGALVGNINETAGVRAFTNCVVTGCTIEANYGFGDNYDDMYGVAAGLIYIFDSTVQFNGCKLEGNTIKGEDSNAYYGYNLGNAAVYVDGVKQ